MLLSVIVPVYNVEKYIARCLDSIIIQNFTSIEIILVDDCSTDCSLKIAETFECFNNVRIFRKETNSGLSDTRNIGIELAQGEYIMFLDSDDYVDVDCFDKISKIIIENDKPSIVYFGFYEEFEGKNQITKQYGYRSEKNRLYSSEDFLINELGKRNLYAAACFGIYKRSFLIENQLFFKSKILHEDELWTPQVLLKALDIFTSDYAYYHYSHRPNSITQRRNKSQNGIDLINSCKELDCITEAIDNPLLKKYIKNHIAKLYMKAMTEGKLYERDKRKHIERLFPLRRAYFVKERIKAIIFAISLHFYYILNSIGDFVKKNES